MSHFPVLVLVEEDASDREACESKAAELLAPYDENGEWFRDGSRWDWWMVGGRFCGMLDGYDPVADPRNQETCHLCAGTGRRESWPESVTEEWIEQCNGCNGCRGTGTRVVWPTNLAPHDGDVMAARDVDRSKMPYAPVAIVTPDGQWHEEVRVGWFGTELERSESPGDWMMVVDKLLEQYRHAAAVVVDCHV